MRTGLDCLPCFLRQMVQGARLAAPGREDLHQAVARESAAFLSRADLDRSPPDLAGELYARITAITGNPDPFQEQKRAANARVKELLPELGAMVAAGRTSPGGALRAALHLAIIGNYIDAGVARVYDWERALTEEPEAVSGEAFDRFLAAVSGSARVLILGDNAGEIGLDRLLVQELLHLGCDVAYAVRGGPILNDATLEDAREMGLEGMCRVVSSGLVAPGTIVERVSAELRTELELADLVLSKGQGNFESLHGRRSGVYYAFKVKCDTVAKYLDAALGASVFRFA